MSKEIKMEMPLEIASRIPKYILDHVNERDWPEDYEHDGCYINHCAVCKGEFLGHKRRTVCKECATKEIKTEGKR